MLPDLVHTIQQYTDAVRRGDVQPTCNLCPHCHRDPGKFRLHDRRERSFLVIVGRTVRRVFSLLGRWKCSLCKVSFTLYPPFAVPHKRYVRDCVFELQEHYLEHDELSYRDAVKVDGMPVFYDSGDHGAIDERSLAHSTLHRWIPFFVTLGATLLEARRLIRARSAATDLFRKVLPIAPGSTAAKNAGKSSRSPSGRSGPSASTASSSAARSSPNSQRPRATAERQSPSLATASEV